MVSQHFHVHDLTIYVHCELSLPLIDFSKIATVQKDLKKKEREAMEIIQKKRSHGAVFDSPTQEDKFMYTCIEYKKVSKILSRNESGF